MPVDIAVAFGALLLMAVLAGIAVRGLLAASRRERKDDVMAMAARVGDTRMPEFIAARMRRRRAEKVRAELPDALDMVSNSLSAGLTLPQALMRNLSHFPPLVSEEFARILYDTRLGYSIGGAFDNFARRLPIPDVQMVVIASKIGVAHGGNLAESYPTNRPPKVAGWAKDSRSDGFFFWKIYGRAERCFSQTALLFSFHERAIRTF